MAIVNPSMLQVYDDIEPELLKCVEDVIFDTDPLATERLIAKASAMLEAKEAQNVQVSVQTKDDRAIEERLQEAVVKGRCENLEADLKEALEKYGKAVDVIEGPLMKGMERVGELFGDGKMFLPQVVKAAKVMRDAVDILGPDLTLGDVCSEGPHPLRGHPLAGGGMYSPQIISKTHNPSNNSTIFKKDVAVIATVKGDVHDIGKNIVGIVLSCNGFEVHDLGVMVDRETILSESERLKADVIFVSGLITPSLYQMEELCREMAARGMNTPLFIGGATTSALHTAVKLAPLYDHVFYGPDASASAVLAKKCMMDREGFEKEQHIEQEKTRELYMNKDKEEILRSAQDDRGGFDENTYPTACPTDIPAQEIPAEEVLPYFDWKMFYAIWGVKYGSAVPEAAELMQLRRDAEEELKFGDYMIQISAKFLQGHSEGNDIVSESYGKEIRLPMLRQENGRMLSLSDFVISKESGRTSPFGVFAITVGKRSKAHVEGCSCPACNSRYEDMIGRTVRQTMAEAASKWLSARIENEVQNKEIKIVKPAAGYSSCPDHTLKRDILTITGNLGIKLTESCAMTPEASICGMIFMHSAACYPEIRTVSREQYEDYCRRRQMDEQTARQFLGYLLK